MVDAHERYPFRFAGQQVRTVRRGLSCGDYAVALDGRVVAAVERKSVADLVSSLTRGRLRYALGELAALARAAVVVEDRYSAIFALERIRPALVADGLAELQVRWPTVRSRSATTASWPRSGPTLAAAFEQPSSDHLLGTNEGASPPGPALHHICTTRGGKTGSPTVTNGHPESASDLPCC